jgi:hypothetical protein
VFDPGDDDEENLEEILESQEGRRGGEGNVPGPAFESPGLGGRDFDVMGGVDSGGWGVWPFCGDAGMSSAVGGND